MEACKEKEAKECNKFDTDFFVNSNLIKFIDQIKLSPDRGLFLLFVDIKLTDFLFFFPVNQEIIDFSQAVENDPQTDGSDGKHGIEKDHKELVI